MREISNFKNSDIQPFSIINKMFAHTKISVPQPAGLPNETTYIPDGEPIPPGCTEVKYYNEGDPVGKGLIHDHKSGMALGYSVTGVNSIQRIGGGIPVRSTKPLILD